MTAKLCSLKRHLYICFSFCLIPVKQDCLKKFKCTHEFVPLQFLLSYLFSGVPQISFQDGRGQFCYLYSTMTPSIGHSCSPGSITTKHYCMDRWSTLRSTCSVFVVFVFRSVILFRGSYTRDWIYTPFSCPQGKVGQEIFRLRKVILSVIDIYYSS